MSLDYEKNRAIDESAPDSWCPLPWTHIATKTNGSYRLCCHSYYSGLEGNHGILKDDNQKHSHVSSSQWEDILNCKQMKNIRKTMLKGKWPKECKKCQNENKTQGHSYNLKYRKNLSVFENYPHYLKARTRTKEDGSISLEDFPITYLDIRFGNLCNLKCVMCGPNNSSKWHEDWQALTEHNYFVAPPDFWSGVKSLSFGNK